VAARILLVSGLGLLGACGDGGEEGASKADFVDAADVECKTAKTRIDENTEKIPPDLRAVNPFGPDQVSPEDLRRLAPFTEELGDIYGDLRTALSKVEAPAEDEDRIEEILADLATAAKGFKTAAASFRSGERPEQEPPIAQVAAPSRELADYGANSCLHSGN
jgi:hypothetical protein